MGFEEDIKKINTQIDTLSIDKIKTILAPHRKGICVKAPVIEKDNFFYRGRILNKQFKKSNPIKLSDLSFPRQKIKLGRANREDTPIFYCSSGKEIVFYELRVKEGDELILSNWQSSASLLVNSIGYTSAIFDKLGSVRAKSTEGNEKSFYLDEKAEQETQRKIEEIAKSDPHSKVQAYLHTQFMREDTKMYKLTAAIAEMHLGKIKNHSMQFGGVIYPSVRMSANGDNLAILPWYAENHLQLKRAAHIRVTSRTGNQISIEELDYANSFDEEGNLSWKGRSLYWNCPAQTALKMVVEKGVDQFGYYEMGKTGEPLHWKAYNDKGEAVPPA